MVTLTVCWQSCRFQPWTASKQPFVAMLPTAAEDSREGTPTEIAQGSLAENQQPASLLTLEKGYTDSPSMKLIFDGDPMTHLPDSKQEPREVAGRDCGDVTEGMKGKPEEGADTLPNEAGGACEERGASESEEHEAPPSQGVSAAVESPKRAAAFQSAFARAEPAFEVQPNPTQLECLERLPADLFSDAPGWSTQLDGAALSKGEKLLSTGSGLSRFAPAQAQGVVNAAPMPEGAADGGVRELQARFEKVTVRAEGEPEQAAFAAQAESDGLSERGPGKVAVEAGECGAAADESSTGGAEKEEDMSKAAEQHSGEEVNPVEEGGLAALKQVAGSTDECAGIAPVLEVGGNQEGSGALIPELHEVGSAEAEERTDEGLGASGENPERSTTDDGPELSARGPADDESADDENLSVAGNTAAPSAPSATLPQSSVASEVPKPATRSAAKPPKPTVTGQGITTTSAESR